MKDRKVDLKNFDFGSKLLLIFVLFLFLSASGIGIYLVTSKTKGIDNLFYLNLSGILLMLFYVGYIIIEFFIGRKLGLLEFDFKWANKRNMYTVLGITLLAVLLSRSMGYFLSEFEFLFSDNVTTSYDLSYFEKISPVLNVFIILLQTVISAPIIEEILFRGIIMKLFFGSNAYIKIILSSIIFGLFHYSNGVFFIIHATMLGILLGISYYKTSKLEVPILIHVLFNAQTMISGLF